MSAEHFKEGELLHLVLKLLLNQLLDQFFELWLTRGRYQGLFKQDLINQSVYVSSTQESKSLALLLKEVALTQLSS